MITWLQDHWPKGTLFLAMYTTVLLLQGGLMVWDFLVLKPKIQQEGKV